MLTSYNEFHISRAVRDACKFDDSLYASSGNVIFANLKAVQKFQLKLNALFDERGEHEKRVSAGSLNAMGLIDEIFHYVCMLYRRDKAPRAFKNLLADLDLSFGKEKMDSLLLEFMAEFPPVAVYQGKISAEEFLKLDAMDEGTKAVRSNREQVLEEMILLHLANENPAFHPFAILFDDKKLAENPDYIKTWNQIKAYFKTQPVFGPKKNDLINMLKEPVVASPTSLKGQLDYIRQYWADLLGEWLRRLLEGIDTLSEEEKAAWHPTLGGDVELMPPDYNSLLKEYERFSPDRDWMPKVVLMAKTVLVWLYQLSKKYNREITRLDQIPDEELDLLRDEGFTGLWLIGLWERSYASKRIKQINGNPEAAASAYSLMDYDIAWNLGGWDALDNLRRRCWVRGIRLASDMVPNHTGMDGKWVIEHPDRFVQTKECPFNYSFNGENLSQDSRVSVYLDDNYYNKTDCAVCFKRVDNATGDVTYIYHGNDGTGMPWNDTAQIDFLNPEAREAVIQKIMHVARNFPIIRFDAAMVLAKKHIRRLWYPEPGHGGDIASRSRWALTNEEFEARIPNEFWREVVDRCAQEMPDPLLLAEAFWMMEGYFTRTLGMHRVYNSAFMNMLKKEENQKYRDTVKNTIKFDPQILKRYVNFMNNPDEETAVAQFGRGDKYFGVCTLMVTMPGLPMFGHGQLEGFEEKYGMEYTRAYRDEHVDEGLYNRHWHDIFPLMHKRYLFAGVDNFLFYDVWKDGRVNENIFAYSNGVNGENTIVFYNNKYERADGWIKQSCQYAVKTGSGEDDKKMVSRSLAEGLGLSYGSNHYVIFREHRSGLWYVRRSDDIINGGMYVSLNGFEYQVYLDVHEVVDDAEGKFYHLNELLNGSGTEDLDVAWQEYRYKEMYEKLSAFLIPEFYDDAKLLFTPAAVLKANKTKALSVKEVFEKVKDSALAYFELESRFDSETEEEVPDADMRLEIFEDNLIALKNTMDGVFASASSKKASLYSVICEGLKGETNAALILLSFLAVSSCGGENAVKWGFPRKLTEYMRRAGLDVNGVKETLLRLFSCEELSAMNFDSKSLEKTAYASAVLLMETPASAMLTGAHEYNGVRWFNKELYEKTLAYMLASLASFDAGSEEELLAFANLLAKAENASGYDCAKFTEALKPAEVKAKKVAAKKTAEKSAPKAEEKPAAKTVTKAVKKAEPKPEKETKADAKKTKAPAKKAEAKAEPKAAKTTAKKVSEKKTVEKTTATKTAAAKTTAVKAKAEKASATKAVKAPAKKVATKVASTKVATKTAATKTTATKKTATKVATKTAAKKETSAKAVKATAKKSTATKAVKETKAKATTAKAKTAEKKTTKAVKTPAKKTATKVASTKAASTKVASTKTSAVKTKAPASKAKSTAKTTAAKTAVKASAKVSATKATAKKVATKVASTKVASTKVASTKATAAKAKAPAKKTAVKKESKTTKKK